MAKKLPIFKNNDKSGWMENEQWSEKYNPNDEYSALNFPTCKMLLIARPNSGKTNFIKNIILFQRPEFEFICIVHHDPETNEYDDLVDGKNIIMTNDIPTVDMFEVGVKNLCVIDDYYTKGLSKEQEKNLNKLVTYVSSHRHCHVVISCHDYTTVPTQVRRSVDVFALWKMIDFESQKMLAKKFGLSNQELYQLFRNKELIKSKYDFLVVDLLPDSDLLGKFRINGLERIDDSLEGNDELNDRVEKRREKENPLVKYAGKLR